MRPMPHSTATPSPPASNPTSMRRGYCDVDVAAAASRQCRGCVSSPDGSMLECSAFILTQSAPHTMVDTGQEAHSRHRLCTGQLTQTRLASRRQCSDDDGGDRCELGRLFSVVGQV